MSKTLWLRVFNYAVLHSDRPKWKARKFALLYGASLRTLAKIK